jgi:hypothetical protein
MREINYETVTKILSIQFRVELLNRCAHPHATTPASSGASIVN